MIIKSSDNMLQLLTEYRLQLRSFLLFFVSSLINDIKGKKNYNVAKKNKKKNKKKIHAK